MSESEHPEPGADPRTPQERLRALELSGDPDARSIALRYKDSPLTPSAAPMRQVARSLTRPARAFEPTFTRATAADAAEAEEKYAAARARREQEQRERERKLFEFAEGADTRERLMVRLTLTSVALAAIGLIVAIAAVIVAA